MTPDLATCEWHPGSNRSVVDPIVAVARLDMPASTRALLIEKMSKHKFDDVVHITWTGIASESSNSYEAAISNMNFANGRLCKTITRQTWTPDHIEDAIVYIVDGRAFGYAAACGNLFELTRKEPEAPSLPPPTAMALEETLLPALLAPPTDTFVSSSSSEITPSSSTNGFYGAASGAWLSVGGGGGGACCCPPLSTPPPVTPVPELPAWMLMFTAFAMVPLRWVRK
jgi:hypothetical protein